MAFRKTAFPHAAFSYGAEIGTGYVLFVDSGAPGASDGNLGDSPERALATIEGAFNHPDLTASNGDTIVVMPGHVETVTAAGGLTLDVAGVTVVFLGEGASRAQVTFTTVVGADMNVTAAGVTLRNPRFVAGIDALTGPIDVNAANFKMYNVLVEDAAAIAATDWLVADANADDLLIDGWEYRVSTTGTQKQSNIQIAGATRPILKNIRITGDFGTGCIENGTAWIDATLDDVIIDNAATGPVVGILLQSTSSGQMRNVNIRVASGTTYLTANNDMQFFNCSGVGVDADGAEQVGAIIASSVEGKIDVIDGFHDVPAQDATTDSQMRDVVGKKDDTASVVPATTDSLVSYVKGIQASGPMTLTKTDGAMLTGDDPLFTITGGSIHVISIIGTVTTIIGGSGTMHLNCAVTTPSADVSMSTAVAIDNDDAGTVYHFLGETGVLTPVTAGLVFLPLDDAADGTDKPTQWIVPIGTIEGSGSAAQTGVIAWTMTYYNHSGATVTVAA